MVLYGKIWIKNDLFFFPGKCQREETNLPMGIARLSCRCVQELPKRHVFLLST